MASVDTGTYLSYLQSFVISAKSIKEEIEWRRLCGEQTTNAEQRLQEVCMYTLIRVRIVVHICRCTSNMAYPLHLHQIMEKHMAISCFMLMVKG